MACRLRPRLRFGAVLGLEWLGERTGIGDVVWECGAWIGACGAAGWVEGWMIVIERFGLGGYEIRGFRGVV